jgi:23S rRNA pseudouridine1911/1915/1917 synthase
VSAKWNVLFEDNHCLAVVKPAGLLTAGDRTGDETLLEQARRYLKEKYHKPGNVFLGLVHRLDRPVSGVVLFARTSKAAARLSEQFRAGRVVKVYHAWVQGVPRTPAGTWTDFLLKDRERNVVRSVSAETTGAQQAMLGYRLLGRAGRTALLEIRPQTGRAHQIRVQLASRGFPILGDVKYGARPTPNGRLLLHAFELTFEHPVRNERISLQAPEPEDWPLEPPR